MAEILPLTHDSQLKDDSTKAKRHAKMVSFAALKQPSAQQQDATMQLYTRRFCHRSGSPLIVPQSKAEWKRCLFVVKGHHSNGRHRECATRCQDVLGNIRNPDTVENAHLIFLHFYAATSLEMQCRNLHHASPARLGLFKEAQTHYHAASKLVSSEEHIVSNLTILSLSPSSTMMDSPQHSPTFSHHSHSTRLSSPCPSEEPLEKDQKDNDEKIVKQVRFEDEDTCMAESSTTEPKDISLPKAESEADEDLDGATFSRPDSPTLGFDDWLGRSSPDLIVPPLQPLTPTSPEVAEIEVAQPEQEQPEQSEIKVEEDEEEDLSSSLFSTLSQKDPYELCASVHRYRDILASLQEQITSHQSFIEKEIASSQNPNRYFSEGNEAVRKMELQARIERLKANGWNRKRFDVAKYEALRERALADAWA